jgi:hypothetical protein
VNALSANGDYNKYSTSQNMVTKPNKAQELLFQHETDITIKNEKWRDST